MNGKIAYNFTFKKGSVYSPVEIEFCPNSNLYFIHEEDIIEMGAEFISINYNIPIERVEEALKSSESSADDIYIAHKTVKVVATILEE